MKTFEFYLIYYSICLGNLSAAYHRCVTLFDVDSSQGAKVHRLLGVKSGLIPLTVAAVVTGDRCMCVRCPCWCVGSCLRGPKTLTSFLMTWPSPSWASAVSTPLPWKQNKSVCSTKRCPMLPQMLKTIVTVVFDYKRAEYSWTDFVHVCKCWNWIMT